MKRIKVGDVVTAHLDGTFTGKVVDIVNEQSKVWSATGPMSDEVFCYVELQNGKVVKRKISDLYVSY